MFYLKFDIKGSLIFISILSILILSISMASAEDVSDVATDDASAVPVDTIEETSTIENNVDEVALSDTLDKKADEKIKTAKERTKTKLIYEDMYTTSVVEAYDGRTGEYFNVTLLDENDKPMAGRLVQIGFNGKVYPKTTDENGFCRLQINLPAKGTYTFAICYLGDDDYESVFEVAKIVVSPKKMSLTVPTKSYKASAKTKTLTATLKDNKGHLIKSKVISFTVNGKIYTAKTNSKGVATVKVSLSTKKTYYFTVKFAGDNKFAAVTKTGKVTIK